MDELAFRTSGTYTEIQSSELKKSGDEDLHEMGVHNSIGLGTGIH